MTFQPFGLQEWYLAQHLIILHVVHTVGADLPLQSILVESATDVDQEGGGAGVNDAAQGGRVNIARNVNTVSQDHADN